MRTLLLVFLAVLGLAASTPPAAAQAPAPAAVEQSAPGVAAPSEGAASLPRYTPPRTLRAYWHLFGAFAFAWVLLFGYTVAVARRFGRIEKELEGLRG